MAYDARWVLGQGAVSDGEILPMSSFRGFCPACPAVPTTASDGGRIELRFDGARSAVLSTDAYYPLPSSAHWRRGPVGIVPLSEPAFRPESQ